MPNWCHNRLSVRGEGLTEFAEAVADEHHGSADPDGVRLYRPLSFEKILPTPPVLLKRQAASDGPDWYSWRLDHWGTKWDASFDVPMVAMGTEDSVVEPGELDLRDGNSLRYVFHTAWSPPEPVIAVLASAYPKLTFELWYAEPGNDFAGRTVWRDGQMVECDQLRVEDVLEESEMWS